jgi:hypothetical protein
MVHNPRLPNRIEYTPQTPGLRSAAEVIAEKTALGGDTQPSPQDLAVERISRLITENYVDLPSGDVARTLIAFTALADEVRSGSRTTGEYDYEQQGDFIALSHMATAADAAIEQAARIHSRYVQGSVVEVNHG